MLRTILTSLVLTVCSLATQAQDTPEFSVSIDRDTILMGNVFEVSFALENARGQDFDVEDLSENFELVGGPNISSSIQIINGEMSQQQSWSFYLRPKSEGIFYIPPASVRINGEYLSTLPLEVWVTPNPDGIVEPPAEQASPFGVPVPEPPVKPKKKRKVTRI
ncbi:MAG: protein BatD [Bacteroidetes bacterium]|nr:protein BatD [Bacteroidota bacterium]